MCTRFRMVSRCLFSDCSTRDNIHVSWWSMFSYCADWVSMRQAGFTKCHKWHHFATRWCWCYANVQDRLPLVVHTHPKDARTPAGVTLVKEEAKSILPVLKSLLPLPNDSVFTSKNNSFVHMWYFDITTFLTTMIQLFCCRKFCLLCAQINY